MTHRSPDHETIEAEINCIRSLGLDELRALWRTTLRSSPPPSFTKDLMARFICISLHRTTALGCGAKGRNRTTDTVIFSHVLFQLIYAIAFFSHLSERVAFGGLTLSPSCRPTVGEMS